MFFGLLRRANVLPSSSTSFDPTIHLRRRDITFTEAGMRLTIRWSKTNQFRTREFVIPFPRIPGHLLCPTQATFLAFKHCPLASPDGPAFVYPTRSGVAPLTASALVQLLKSRLQPHADVSTLSGHSFRRGGACWAYSSGVPVDIIRQLGDWRSNAYTAYTLCDGPLLTQAMSAMTASL